MFIALDKLLFSHWTYLKLVSEHMGSFCSLKVTDWLIQNHVTSVDKPFDACMFNILKMLLQALTYYDNTLKPWMKWGTHFSSTIYQIAFGSSTNVFSSLISHILWHTVVYIFLWFTSSYSDYLIISLVILLLSHFFCFILSYFAVTAMCSTPL